MYFCETLISSAPLPPNKISVIPKTLSPTLNAPTFFPISIISPLKSHPMINGNFFTLVIILNPPSSFFKSTGLGEMATTFTMTSFIPGFGLFNSVI